MATPIKMTNPQTGFTKTGYIYFSWTTLFFGPLPALFRSDFITFIGFSVIYIILIGGGYTIGDDDDDPFLLVAVLQIGGMGLWCFLVFCYFMSVQFVWAFMYNGYYTRKLLEKGYIFADTPELEKKARIFLGIVSPQPPPRPAP
jgi:hypothetical protein